MALEVKNLVKTYGDYTAVNNLSFSIDKPGVFGLLGTNGAGKTTTIRMILGMLAKNSGEKIPDYEIITFALAGNQNCGKTTLFNWHG